MQVTPATLGHIFDNLDMRFNQTFTSTEAQWERIATEVPSSGRANEYPMSSFVAQMREWIGERQVQNATAYTYRIENKDFEATFSVKRNDIEDDQLGIYANDASSLGEAAKTWPDEVVFDKLMQGETTAGHDGQNFFDEDHPVIIGDESSATQSNLFEVPDLTPEVLNALETVAAAWANEKGDTFGIVFDTLVVPPSLRFKAREAVGPQRVVNVQGGGNVVVDNPMANAYDVLVVPRLAKKPKEFYLMLTKKVLKPLIWQVRKRPEFVSLNDPTDPNVFWRKEYIYGVDARGNAGFGLWFMALKAKIVAGAPLPEVPEQP